jgi:hypothetical protein
MPSWYPIVATSSSRHLWHPRHPRPCSQIATRPEFAAPHARSKSSRIHAAPLARISHTVAGLMAKRITVPTGSLPLTIPGVLARRENLQRDESVQQRPRATTRESVKKCELPLIFVLPITRDLRGMAVPGWSPGGPSLVPALIGRWPVILSGPTVPNNLRRMPVIPECGAGPLTGKLPRRDIRPRISGLLACTLGLLPRHAPLPARGWYSCPVTKHRRACVSQVFTSWESVQVTAAATRNTFSGRRHPSPRLIQQCNGRPPSERSLPRLRSRSIGNRKDQTAWQNPC